MACYAGFAHNTAILMGDHTIKNIQDIKTGDIILNHLYHECTIENTEYHANCNNLYEITYAYKAAYTINANQKIALIHEHKIIHMTAKELYELDVNIRCMYKGIYKTMAGYQPINITINKKNAVMDCYEIKAKSTTYALRGADHALLCI